MEAYMMKMPSKFREMTTDEITYRGGSDWGKTLVIIGCVALIGGMIGGVAGTQMRLMGLSRVSTIALGVGFVTAGIGATKMLVDEAKAQ